MPLLAFAEESGERFDHVRGELRACLTATLLQ
ncbi:MAG: hypothetical protein QOI92_1881, partial [Chloroflexota bacterium]|nr:hypothetical protein [Chloroflexota bacterium]